MSTQENRTTLGISNTSNLKQEIGSNSDGGREEPKGKDAVA